MNPNPFAPPPRKRPSLSIALSTVNVSLFGTLAIGAALCKASVYLVAFLALIAFAYALDLAKLHRENPRRD